MRRWTTRGLGAVVIALALVGLFGPIAGGDESSAPDTVRIGLIGTLFRDTPVALVEPMMRPFKSLMESQTGVTGQMVMAKDADELCKQIEEERIHFGVFHGFEFAWAQQKMPKLRPLVVAISHYRHLKAYVVVNRESDITCLAGLGGKKVALPRFSREHCHLFIERRCRDCGGEPGAYFAELVKPQDAEAALDQVADGSVQAAVVDKQALDTYERMKPGWLPYLKIVQESEPFPATVVGYQEGAIDEATLKRFREGLIKANQTRTGKSVLGMCRITAFEQVPDDYEQMLADILKIYPPPAPPSK